jgi:competence protein ComEA
VRRPDPIALQRLQALSSRPPQVGWPSEPWDLDAWPDTPPSLDDWPVRRLASADPAPTVPEPFDVPAAAPVGFPAAVPAAVSVAVPGAEEAPAWAPPPGLAEHARAALLARLPAPLRAGRFDPGRRGAYVVGALGMLAAVAAVAFAVHGRAEAVPSTSPAAPVAVAAGADPISGGVTVAVDVEGRVRRPGLVSLPSGSRVADALRSAGGVLPGTSTRALDLAARVTDGQQLLVGLTAAPAAAGSAPAAGASALVDLNTATADQLDALPHIGPATAAKIIAWRTAHGPFAAVTDLQQVSGIGPSTYQDIAPLVTV